MSEGGKAIFIRTDVRRAAECREAVDATLQRAFCWSRHFCSTMLELFYPHTILECTEEEWDLQMDINLKGTFLMSKAALARE